MKANMFNKGSKGISHRHMLGKGISCQQKIAKGISSQLISGNGISCQQKIGKGISCQLILGKDISRQQMGNKYGHWLHLCSSSMKSVIYFVENWLLSQ